MDTTAQKKLHYELSEKHIIDCFKSTISIDLNNFYKQLDYLKDCFELEVENNLKEINNYPIAYKYTSKLLYLFTSLKKYNFPLLFSPNNCQKCFDKYSSILTKKIKSFIGILKNFNSMVCDFLAYKKELLKQLRNEYFCIKQSLKKKLSWSGTHTDLIELVELLIGTGLIFGNNQKLALKDGVNEISNLFGIKVKDIYSKLSRAKARKIATKPKVYKIMEQYVNDE